MRENRLAGLDVLTGKPDGFSLRHGEEYLYLILRDSLGLLNQHDGVRPIRDGRARHDLDGLARAEGAGRHDAGLNLLDHFQRPGRVAARARYVFRAQGVAVHRRVVPGRNGA